MNIKERGFSSRLFDCANNIFMVLICIIMLYPLLYVLFSSFSEPSKLVSHTGLLLRPQGFSTSAYEAVFKNKQIVSGYKNTIVYVLVGTSINLVMTSLGAYILTKKNLLLNKVLKPMIFFTMFFSGGMIPRYLIIDAIGLTDTMWALVLPGAISVYNMVIMRTYFSSLPESLIDAAKIDGANDLKILIKVVLPLSIPVIAVMALFYGVGHWNSWFGAVIYLRDRGLYPLQLILREILIQNNTDDMLTGIAQDREAISETIKYAAIIVSTLPIMCIYPFLQKYFVAGVLIGGVKE